MFLVQSEKYLCEAEVADMFGIEPSTLRCDRSRKRHDHPPFIKLGRKCLYPERELAVWLRSRQSDLTGVSI